MDWKPVSPLPVFAHVLLVGKVYAPVRGKDVGCEVPIELDKLGIILEGGGWNGGNGRHYKFFERGACLFFMKLCL